jgi:serine/threonine protein kinase
VTDPILANTDSDLAARLARVLSPAYEVDGEIGRGGMAIVYRARDVRLKRAVAVKLLPPELAFRGDIRTRFLREAETAARLSHPNIVPIYTVDEREGVVYFVMGLVAGGSVGDRLRRSGAMGIDETRRIVREVAGALAYAHRMGVVHRDIKPDNILLDADGGRAMVTDFGIARAVGDDGDGTRLTGTGVAIGTPSYMSPEQCAGDREIDGRSDLYSLGTVAYQMLAGAPPFVGGNTPSIMLKQVTERPLTLRRRRPDVPEDLERIVMTLLEKDPANRFADGSALVAALDGAPVAPIAPRAAAVVGVIEPLSSRDALLPDEEHIKRQVTTALERIVAQHQTRLSPLGDRAARRESRRLLKEQRKMLSLPNRIRRFRKNLFSYGGTTVFLFGINWMTNGGHAYWWFLYPAMGMALGAITEMGSLIGADGVPFRSLFAGPIPGDVPMPAASATLPAPAVLDEVLAGSRGDVLRQATADRRRIQESLGKLSDTERRMLPNVNETADALFERVESLAVALHRLDEQLGADRAPAIDERIAHFESEAGRSSDHERRLTLLKRQRDMVHELEASRDRLREQFESAGLLLQNLSLDLLKVRSSGLDAAMSGIASATQEARALSKEIGYVLDAVDEIRGTVQRTE